MQYFNRKYLKNKKTVEIRKKFYSLNQNHKNYNIIPLKKKYKKETIVIKDFTLTEDEKKKFFKHRFT